MKIRSTIGKPGTLLCFSPQIMALTFAAEIMLMMLVLVRYSVRSVSHRIVLLMILFLAAFQLSEYGVCEEVGFHPQVWARIGFVSITMLPALGLHLIQRVRRDKNLNISYAGYFLALLFVGTFVFFDSFQSVGCEGNYVIFQITDGIGGAYFAYYYLLLMIGTVLAYRGWRDDRGSARSRTLVLIATGYASFVLPATFIHFVFEEASNGLPSIMCGFALIFAFILAFAISKHLPADEA